MVEDGGLIGHNTATAVYDVPAMQLRGQETRTGFEPYRGAVRFAPAHRRLRDGVKVTWQDFGPTKGERDADPARN